MTSSWYEELNDMELFEERTGLLRQLRTAEDEKTAEFLEAEIQKINTLLYEREW